jgi:hypothetical protein
MVHSYEDSAPLFKPRKQKHDYQECRRGYRSTEFLEYMKKSRKQTSLMKAARFVIRSLGHGEPQMVETISNAVRRYRVKQHDLWIRIQSTGHWSNASKRRF